jgi:hypothetical protein
MRLEVAFGAAKPVQKHLVHQNSKMAVALENFSLEWAKIGCFEAFIPYFLSKVELYQ